MDFFFTFRERKHSLLVLTISITYLFSASTQLILISNLCGRSSSYLHLQLQEERHRDVKDLALCYPPSQYEAGSEVRDFHFHL